MTEEEGPSKVELRWRALCRAQVRVARLETLIQEKFSEEATESRIGGRHRRRDRGGGQCNTARRRLRRIQSGVRLAAAFRE